MGEGIVDLTEEQIRRLAKLIRNQELERTQDVQFESEYERAEYMKKVRDNYKEIIELLEKAGVLVEENKDEESKSNIAHDIYEQMKCLVNHSLQAIRNYTVRKEFLAKVIEHADATMTQLRMLSPSDEANVRRLAKDAEAFKEAIKTFNANHNSNISSYFVQQIQEQKLSFDQLVTKYKHKVGLSGHFSELSQADKFLVYEEIIKDSGRGQIFEQGFSLARAELTVGTTLMVFTAALMVWDIFSTPWSGMLERATRDSVDLASGLGGAMLGEFVTTALLEAEIAAFEGAAAATMVTVAGFIGGAAVGFLLGMLVGLVLDEIFSSGGQVPSTHNFKVYVAQMPDARCSSLSPSDQTPLTILSAHSPALHVFQITIK